MTVAEVYVAFGEFGIRSSLGRVEMIWAIRTQQ